LTRLKSLAIAENQRAWQIRLDARVIIFVEEAGMASCEKCWGDAYKRTLTNPMKSQAEHYSDLIKERNGSNKCTPEEQAGGGRTMPKMQTVFYTHTLSCLYELWIWEQIDVNIA